MSHSADEAMNAPQHHKAPERYPEGGIASQPSDAADKIGKGGQFAQISLEQLAAFERAKDRMLEEQFVLVERMKLMRDRMEACIRIEGVNAEVRCARYVEDFATFLKHGRTFFTQRMLWQQARDGTLPELKAIAQWKDVPSSSPVAVETPREATMTAAAAKA